MVIAESWTTPDELPGADRGTKIARRQVLPLYLPSGDGLIGLLSRALYEVRRPSKRTTQTPARSDTEQIEEARQLVIRRNHRGPRMSP